MTELTILTPYMGGELPGKTLRLTVKVWFIAAAIGHWVFLGYILALFYPPLAMQGLQGMEGLHLPSGFRKGDTLGNLAAASHVLLAAIVIGGGPLQLIPAIRGRFPVFHRYLGRVYLTTAVVTALGGLWITWTRGNVGDFVMHLGISGDGLLIIVFAGFTLRHAIARNIATHRRYALRLFMVASAVWFFRVGLMAWIMLTGGIGIDFDTFTGPTLFVLGFAQYLLPLGMLEWYFRCQGKVNPSERLAFSATLAGLTLAMCLGVVAATMGMWLPGILEADPFQAL